MLEILECNNCGKLFSADTGEIEVTVASKYYVRLPRASSDSTLAKLFTPVYVRLINDLRSAEPQVWCGDISTVIQEEVRGIICEHCGAANDRRLFYSVPDQFYLLIEDYIRFEVDNILIDSMHLTSFECELDSSDSVQLRAFVDALPNDLQATGSLLRRLSDCMSDLPCIGGRGGDFGFVDWLLSEVRAELVGYVVTMLLTVGTSKVTSAVRGIATKLRIRQRIKRNPEYWGDLSFDDLQKHFSVPKSFVGSREELIEHIVEQKTSAFKEQLIEKLRDKRKAT